MCAGSDGCSSRALLQSLGGHCAGVGTGARSGIRHGAPVKALHKGILHRLTVHLRTIIQDLCGICAAAGRSTLTRVFSIMRGLDGATSPSAGNSLNSNPLCSKYEESEITSFRRIGSSDQACRL